MKKDDNSICIEKNFKKVYTEQASPLRNFLYYKFGDFEKANDHAQEAFIRLWNNCAKVELEKARSFLFTVAKRLFLDDFEHQKVVLKFSEKQPKKSNYESPDFILREKEFKSELETAISNLSEKQRTVFLMNRIDNIPYKEIATIQEISIKTVEKHMSAALKQLKNNLEAIGIFKI